MSAKSQYLQVRTNIFQNNQPTSKSKRVGFDPSRELVKGNATPITTQAGRISWGEHGAIWAGKLNAWSVWMDTEKEWSTVMPDAGSPVCGLTGIVLAALEELEVIEDPSSEELQELVETLLDTDVIFEIPSLKREELFEEDSSQCLYELAEAPHHITGEIDFSIGVKRDGGFSIKATFIGDLEVIAGKVAIVESNRVAIGRAFSDFAKAQPIAAETQKAAFKGALKSQREKNMQRRARYSQPKANEVNTAGLEEVNQMPPVM